MGSAIFSSAFWIALPMIAMLLFVNLVLGIISRVAPQMNIYAVGLPGHVDRGPAGPDCDPAFAGAAPGGPAAKGHGSLWGLGRATILFIARYDFVVKR